MADENWRDSLPLNLRGHESLSKFKDVPGLVQSYIDLESHMSSTNRMPKDGDKEESWNSYYKAWGRPDKFEDYKLIDMPKEYAPDEEFSGNLRKMAHGLGLNQKQFNQMMEWGLNTSRTLFEKTQQLKQQAQDGLQQEWGFRYDDNKSRAQKTIAMLVDYKRDHPFVQWLESTGNADNPEVLRFFYSLSKRFGEDTFVDEITKTELAEKSEAQKKILEIMADSKGPYFNEYDPRHKDAVKEMARLYTVAYPEE